MEPCGVFRVIPFENTFQSDGIADLDVYLNSIKPQFAKLLKAIHITGGPITTPSVILEETNKL